MGVSEAVLHVSGRLQWPARALAPVYPRLQVAGRRCHLGLAHFAAGLRVESRSPMLACLPPLAHVPPSHHLPATVPGLGSHRRRRRLPCWPLLIPPPNIKSPPPCPAQNIPIPSSHAKINIAAAAAALRPLSPK